MASVQPLDPGDRSRQQAIVLWRRLRGCVEPVGQQGEADVPFGIRQEVDLEAGHALLHVHRASEEGRDDDQRAKRARHAVLELEPGQRPRAEQRRDDAVDERHREVRSGSEPEGGDEHQRRTAAGATAGQ